jgi:hypothetical protein
MKSRGFFSVLAGALVLWLGFALGGASLATSALSERLAERLAERLTDGRHVLLMRHAYAPGVGDPAGYALDRCDSQRQLDAQGRAQAVGIGRWLG